MNLLFVDTSTSEAVAMAWTRGREPVIRRRTSRFDLAAFLPAWCEETLAAAGLAWSGIDRLAVGTGPGSLTGLRVGIAFLRTVAQVRSLPLLPVDRFRQGAATLLATGWRGDVILAVPAFSGQFFVRRFSADGLIAYAVGRDQLPVAPVGLPAAGETEVASVGSGETDSGQAASRSATIALVPAGAWPTGSPVVVLAPIERAPAGIDRVLACEPITWRVWCEEAQPPGLLEVAPQYVVPSQAELVWMARQAGGAGASSGPVPQ